MKEGEKILIDLLFDKIMDLSKDYGGLRRMIWDMKKDLKEIQLKIEKKEEENE